MTLKPTADGSSSAGRLTLPKSGLPGSEMRVAPVPMNRLASVMDKVSKSPLRTWLPVASGSSIPLTVLRLIVSVALPKTTSEMLSPMDPPIRKVGSLGVNATAAPEREP